MPIYNMRENSFNLMLGKKVKGEFRDCNTDIWVVYEDGSAYKANKNLYVVPDKDTTIWLTSGGQLKYDRIMMGITDDD